MRSHSIALVPVDLIDDAGLTDRLDDDPKQGDLIASLREYGQQIPVLLRHSPNVEGRYEVVCGRRRIAALRVLEQPVRAMIRNLRDRDLILAQGQENTARVNLSFIEKANFAGQMAQMAFDRKVICDALAVDKTTLSRMLKVQDALPQNLIRAIGAAPGTGRDRWLALAGALTDDAAALSASADIDDSDARFEAALASQRRPRKPKQVTTQTHDWGQVSRSPRKITLSLGPPDFGDWLVDQLDDLHVRWRAEQTDEASVRRSTHGPGLS